MRDNLGAENKTRAGTTWEKGKGQMPVIGGKGVERLHRNENRTEIGNRGDEEKHIEMRNRWSQVGVEGAEQTKFRPTRSCKEKG